MSHRTVFRTRPRNAIFFVATCALMLWARGSFSHNISVAGDAPLAAPTLAPFASTGTTTLNPAWEVTGLPKNKAPLTEFIPFTLDGAAVLQVHTQASYGVLTHAWQGPAPDFLSWRWRLEQPLAAADLRTKAGDDAALKVCVMFDQPLTDIPFFQRAVLGLARTATRQNLPSATLCYLWDSRYPAGTRGPNPYSARVRYIVLNGSESGTGQWANQRRRIADDFALLFGQESKALPPITAIAVGADSDNTQGSSLGYLTQLRCLP